MRVLFIVAIGLVIVAVQSENLRKKKHLVRNVDPLLAIASENKAKKIVTIQKHKNYEIVLYEYEDSDEENQKSDEIDEKEAVKVPHPDFKTSRNISTVKSHHPDFYTHGKIATVKTPPAEFNTNGKKAAVKTTLPDFNTDGKKAAVRTPLPDFNTNGRKAAVKTPLPDFSTNGKKAAVKTPIPNFNTDGQKVAVKTLPPDFNDEHMAGFKNFPPDFHKDENIDNLVPLVWDPVRIPTSAVTTTTSTTTLRPTRSTTTTERPKRTMTTTTQRPKNTLSTTPKPVITTTKSVEDAEYTPEDYGGPTDEANKVISSFTKSQSVQILPFRPRTKAIEERDSSKETFVVTPSSKPKVKIVPTINTKIVNPEEVPIPKGKVRKMKKHNRTTTRRSTTTTTTEKPTTITIATEKSTATSTTPKPVTISTESGDEFILSEYNSWAYAAKSDEANKVIRPFANPRPVQIRPFHPLTRAIEESDSRKETEANQSIIATPSSKPKVKVANAPINTNTENPEDFPIPKVKVRKPKQHIRTASHSTTLRPITTTTQRLTTTSTTPNPAIIPTESGEYSEQTFGGYGDRSDEANKVITRFTKPQQVVQIQSLNLLKQKTIGKSGSSEETTENQSVVEFPSPNPKVKPEGISNISRKIENAEEDAVPKRKVRKQTKTRKSTTTSATSASELPPLPSPVSIILSTEAADSESVEEDVPKEILQKNVRQNVIRRIQTKPESPALRNLFSILKDLFIEEVESEYEDRQKGVAQNNLRRKGRGRLQVKLPNQATAEIFVPSTEKLFKSKGKDLVQPAPLINAIPNVDISSNEVPPPRSKETEQNPNTKPISQDDNSSDSNEDDYSEVANPNFNSPQSIGETQLNFVDGHSLNLNKIPNFSEVDLPESPQQNISQSQEDVSLKEIQHISKINQTPDSPQSFSEASADEHQLNQQRTSDSSGDDDDEYQNTSTSSIEEDILPSSTKIIPGPELLRPPQPNVRQRPPTFNW